MSFGGGGHSHGGGGAAPAFGGGGHGHGGGGQVFARGGGGGHGRGYGGGSAAPQMRGSGRQQAHGGGHQQARVAQQQRGHGGGHQQVRMSEQRHGHGGGGGQQFGMGQQGHGGGHQQARNFAQQGRGPARDQGHGGFAQQGMVAGRQRGNGMAQQGPQQQAFANQQQVGIQQLGGHGRQRTPGNFGGGAQYAQNVAASPYYGLTYGNNVQVLPVEQVQTFIGAPIGQVASYATLSPIPANYSYLYPATPGYYYEWGDGYLYQVDRTSNLIAALIPLIAGGYLPGQYLPASYMNSYVPDYYGLNSFYPDYGDTCNRYYGGVVYQVDCDDGYVESVVPMYAGGYGVGQLLPAAYNTYNVPMQYRSMYYDTPDAGYWYSPGAIYQYDPRSSVITSVAALMAPGFTVGQPLPIGYDVYNVPLPYRATYYDTPSAWYRYNNGYIYQVDPVSQVVTAIVASLLT
jgi:hypothetical protein